MAIVYQPTLFSWKHSHELGDLERLKMVIESLPDEDFLQALEQHRGNGRDDYPIRPVWNSILAGLIYQHPTNASLERELRRNAQLREICGFDPLKGASAVPNASVYSRFMILLGKFQLMLDRIFDQLVELVGELLPDFGRNISIDSEALTTFSRGKGKPNSEREQRSQGIDRRRDNDADWGKKFILSDYKGKLKRIAKVWFGYKLHLVVDTAHELPIAYSLTRASSHDGPQAHKLIDKMADRQPHILSKCKHLMADRAYDDIKLTVKLWEEHRIKTVIDTRTMWKDDERQLNTRSGVDNVTYTEKGLVFCCCPKSGEKFLMPLAGFERDREAIKFRCPALHHEFECKGRAECSVAKGLRISLAENRRIFTPVPRNSRNWSTLYKTRTSVERTYSRLDTSYGFDAPKLRGLAKFRLKISLSLSVMLAMAVARLHRGQADLIRSLVQTA